MKRILLTTVALSVLGLMHPSFAADLPIYRKAPAAAAPEYDWSGFYVGVAGGYGFGNHDLNNANGPATTFGPATANYSSQGGLGGGEIGYNWQSGHIVLGVETDFFGAAINGNDSAAVGAGTFSGVTAVDQDNLRWTGTLRARGGIAVDRLLLFFTGGWAYGDIDHTSTDPTFGIDKFTVHANGLTAGGGLAYALTDNLIGKFEYRYYNFDSYSRTPPTGALPYKVDSTYSVVTVGLDYKFGGGPVVARY
jgi:outer membrane immunogenic protein